MRTTQRRRSPMIIIWDGIVYIFIWCMSRLYNKVYRIIYPIECEAPGPCHGKFICPSCNRGWNSIRCWPNVGQPCNNCSTYVQPYERRPVQPWDTFVNKLSYLRSLIPTFLVILLIIIVFAIVFFQ